MNECLRTWVATATGAEVTQYARLPGSSSTTLWQVEAGGRRYVLRVFDNADWLRMEPDLVVHEAAALRHAHAGGLPAPVAVALDETGAACGPPLLLMSWMPGAVVLQPRYLDDWLRQLAKMLLTIHDLPAQDFGWSWFSWAPAQPEVPAWSDVPQLWERAIAITAGPPPAAPACFIHRDYHPVNLLWQGEGISAVVDWVNACRGPAAVDLAHCRANLISFYGIEVAERFLGYYRQASGRDCHDMAWWDLASLVESLPGPPEVYPAWAQFGIRHVTAGLMRAQADARLLEVLRQLQA